MAPSITGLSETRIHIGDELVISGSDFGLIQSTSYVTVDGVTADVVSWGDSNITILVPEPTINENDYVVLSVVVGADTVSYSYLWILLGGILRFVEPLDWDTVRLDLDNGGEGEDAEIWQQQGTMIPLPASSGTYTLPDLLDGEELVVTRLPNKDVTLVLLLTAVDKAHLDILLSDLIKELYRETNCLEYRPEGSSKSIYYTTFRVEEVPGTEDYFTHKPLRRQGGYAYNITITFKCLPYAEMSEVTIPVMNNIFPNGNFEKVSGNNFENYDEEPTGGGATITANTSQSILPGGTSCKLTTAANAEVALIHDSAMLPVDSTKRHNLQIFAYKHSGTIKLTATLYCYDSAGTATSPASITLLSNATPSDTGKWHDVMALANGTPYPIIYPAGSIGHVANETFPANTAFVRLEVKHTGSATEAAAVSIDGLLLSESEFIAGNHCESAIGIIIPGEEFVGDISSPMDIYISSAFGAGVWTAQNSGFVDWLQGLEYIAVDNAWACGSGGKLLNNNGSVWLAKTSGTTKNLRSIAYSDATHIWVAGDTGTIRFYNAGTWTEDTYPASVTELVVDGGMANWVSSTDLTSWVEFGGGVVYETYRESTIKKAGSYSARLTTQGGAGTYEWIKSASTFTLDTNHSYTLRFSVRGGQDPGIYGHQNIQVKIYFYDSGGISISNLVLYQGYAPYGSWDDKVIILLGSQIPSNCDRAMLYFRTWTDADADVSWVYVDSVSLIETNIDIYGITALDNNHVIAVGECGTTLFKHNAGAWAKTTSGVSTAYTLRGVYAMASHVWAVGDHGTIIHSGDNGATWTAQSSGTILNLYSVVALDASHVWAVGQDGIILFYNGSSWTISTSPTSTVLRCVGGYLDGSTYYVWAAGDNGVLVERSATTGVWTLQGSGTPESFYDIDACSATKVMAVGTAGTFLTGKATAAALYLTNLIAGQRKEYHAEFNPILDAVTTGAGSLVELYTRHGQKYRAMKGASGDTEEWKFNVAKHKGLYLVSVGGAINNAVNYDQIVLTLQLKDTAGTAITPTTTPTDPTYIDLSVSSAGNTCVGEYFREIAMLAKYPYRFKEITVPSSFVSKNADLLNIDQSILLIAPVGMADGDRLYVDCITLIPVDLSFTEINNWRTGGISGAQQSNMIISSTDRKVLSSLTDKIDSAMVFNPSYWNGTPKFQASPYGVNMTIMASMITGTTTTIEYQFTPRYNVNLKYKPRVLLAGT